MRKNKQAKMLISILLVLMLGLALVGCGGGSSGDPLKGKWEGESDDGIVTTWNFDGNGACKMENEFGAKVEGTYTVEDNILMMQMTDWDEANKYEITLNDGKLSIKNVDESYRPNYELQKK